MQLQRFTGFKGISAYANNTEYFTNLYNKIDSCKYNKAVYNSFLDFILSGFFFIIKRPITKFYNNIRRTKYSDRCMIF